MGAALMGYMLSSIGSLQVDDKVSLYIFVVNGSWRGEPYDTIDRNFESIAERIGERAIIAKGFDKAAWTSQIAKRYFGENSRRLFEALPALLLTDSHPDNLRTDSLRLIVPLREVKGRFVDWDEFFRFLSEFATHQNSDFLSRFKEHMDWFDTANGIVDIRPNIFGIGINLNAAIERWRR
jgi:hypothetical protein